MVFSLIRDYPDYGRNDKNSVFGDVKEESAILNFMRKNKVRIEVYFGENRQYTQTYQHDYITCSFGDTKETCSEILQFVGQRHANYTLRKTHLEPVKASISEHFKEPCSSSNEKHFSSDFTSGQNKATFLEPNLTEYSIKQSLVKYFSKTFTYIIPLCSKIVKVITNKFYHKATKLP